MKNTFIGLSLCLFFSFSCRRSPGPLSDAQVTFRVLADNLNIPWELVWGPDNMIWFTERSGRISRMNPETGTIQPLITISDVTARGEGGLLGMALHPDFNNTPQVFVVYNYERSGTYLEKVVRYNYANNTLVSPVIILDNIQAAGIHNGSRLVFSPEGKLWITTGDATTTSNAQNDGSWNGKILRINTDGTVPQDNPIPGSPVWTKGHRNAQGLVFANNKLYSSEHGATTNDEINIIEKGRNYGWPTVEGDCNSPFERTFCIANNIKQPIYTWTPTIAVCGIDYYNADAIPQWKNSLLMATLKDNTLYQLKLTADGNAIEQVYQIFRGNYGRLRDVCVAPNGKVYVSTSNGAANKIIEISPQP